MTKTLTTACAIALLWTLAAPPVTAQSIEPPEATLARTAVETVPIGARVKLRTRDGERLTAVLLAVDEAAIRVKPATRVPERSRLIRFDQIERIERYRDRVSVGKYAGIGGAIGATVMLVLIVGI